MEESTQPTSWRQESVAIKKEEPPKKNPVVEFMGKVAAVLMGAKKLANIAVSASILLVIFVAGWGGHMLWQWHNGLNEFSLASKYMERHGKSPYLVEKVEEVGRACRNDAHIPGACMSLWEKMEENPQLASVGRYRQSESVER